MLRLDILRNKTQYHANCIAVVHKDKKYIIANYHSIKGATTVMCYLQKGPRKKYNITIEKIKDFIEIDLSIFIISSNSKIKVPFYDFSQIEIPHTHISDICTIQYLAPVFVEKKISFISNICDCNYNGNNIRSIYGNTIQTVVLDVKLTNDMKINDITGMSGGVVTLNKTTIGIISSYDTNTKNIIIIPNYLIYGILNKLNTQNIYYTPNVSKILEFSQNETKTDKKEIYYGILINNDFDKQYTISNINTDKKLSLKNKLIIKLDNNNFDKTGKIYFEQLKCGVSLSSYVYIKTLLNNKVVSNETITIQYFSLVKKNSNKKLLEKTIIIDPFILNLENIK